MSKTIFKNFRIQNGICVEEAEVPLEHQGIVFIKGENLDEGGSNGSGKTSIMELLCYACCGETSKGMRANDLLSLDNPKNLYLGLDFSRDHDYKIEHFREHFVEGTKIRVSVDGMDQTPKTSKSNPKAAQQFALDCVGLTQREIYGSLYLRQKFNHAMISGTPAEKRNLISAYFGLDSIDTAITTTTKRIKSIQLQDETQLQNLKTSIEEELVKYTDNVEDKIKEADLEQHTLQQKILTLRTKIDEQQRAKEIVQQREQVEKTLQPYELSFVDDLENISDQINKDLVLYNNNLASLKRRNVLENELQTLGAKPDISYDKLREDLAQVNTEVQEAEQALAQTITRSKLQTQLSNITDWQVPKQVLEENIQLLKQQLGEPQKELLLKQAELEQLRKLGSVCDRCLRPISKEEHEKLVNDRVARLAELNTVVKETTENLGEFIKALEDTDKRLAITNEMSGLFDGDPSAIKEIVNSLKAQKAEIEILTSRIIRITTLVNQLNELPHVHETETQLLQFIQLLSEKAKVVKQAQAWYLRNGVVAFDLSALSRLQSESLILEENFRSTTIQIAQWKEQLNTKSRLQEQLVNVEKMLATSTAEKNRSRVLEVVHVVLNDARKMKLRESTELLTQVLPSNIKQLYPKGDVGIEVTDDGGELDIFLRKSGKLVPMKWLSGGQEKRVGIAIVFAFAKMGSRLTNLLLADEPFKDLDKSGRAAVYELICDLGMDTILITSHDDDVGIDSKYDQTWIMRMKNGKSTLYKE